MDEGRTNVTVDILVDCYIAWDDSHHSSPQGYESAIRFDSSPSCLYLVCGLLGWRWPGKPYRHCCKALCGNVAICPLLVKSEPEFGRGRRR
jgi:hypothetical protein